MPSIDGVRFMRCPIVIIALSLVSAHLTLAVDPELSRLKSSYDAAVERAVAPIRANYQKELQKLLDRQTKAGKLEAALETKEELAVASGKGESLASKADAPKSTARFFVNKTWTESGGSSFAFQKDGAGLRQYKDKKSAFVWRETENGLVEINGEVPGVGKMQTLYFRFVSGIEGYYGDTSDAVKMRVTLKRSGL